MVEIKEPFSSTKLNSCDGCKIGSLEFCRLIGNSDKLISFLISHGVLVDKRICRKCGHTIKANWNSSFFRCSRSSLTRVGKRCRYSVSVFDNTFFSRSNVPYDSLCAFMSLWLTRDPPKQGFLQRETGWSPGTIVGWSAFCRNVCTELHFRTRKKLGGPGIVVELHEEKLRKRERKPQPIARGQWVFIGVEKENSERIFMASFDKSGQEFLARIIKNNVLPGSTVVSNCWKRYKNCLSAKEFLDLKLNDGMTFIDLKKGKMSQSTEAVVSEVRKKVLKFSRKRASYHGYLAEYMFKREFPDDRDRIHEFFKAAGHLYPPLC